MDTYKKLETQKVVVGLDIGASKVAVVSASITDTGVAEVIGYGKGDYQSAGVINQGVIVHVEDVSQAIKRAIANMELMAPCGDITAVYAGLTGKHVKGCNSQGVVGIENSEVTSEDISQVLDPAQVVPLSIHGCRLLHIKPQGYLVDGQSGVKEPRGMLGNRLEAKVHVAVCDENIANNLERCIESCQLQVLDIALNVIATSNAVLLPEDKDLGVCVVDIGAGTTDIAVFADGAIQYTGMIPLGGCEVTNDIALGLQLARAAAEAIKISHGCALQQLVEAGEALSTEVNGQKLDIPRHLLAQISEARYSELFSLVCKLLKANGCMDVVKSIILTGGAVCMEGIKPLAEEVFQKQIRIGIAVNARGLDKVVNNPAYSTATGLLMQGVDDYLADFDPKPVSALRSLRNWIYRYL